MAQNMTPEDALSIVDSVLSKVAASREEHVTMQIAIDTLASTIAPPEPKESP